MPQQTLITVVQGDADYFLNFTLTDAAGVIVNLTGGTLTFNAQLESNLATQFSASMGITSPTAGTCFLEVASSNFNVPGTYNCQIVVFFSSSSEQITFSGIQVVSVARIPV